MLGDGRHLGPLHRDRRPDAQDGARRRHRFRQALQGRFLFVWFRRSYWRCDLHLDAHVRRHRIHNGDALCRRHHHRPKIFLAHVGARHLLGEGRHCVRNHLGLVLRQRQQGARRDLGRDRNSLHHIGRLQNSAEELLGRLHLHALQRRRGAGRHIQRRLHGDAERRLHSGGREQAGLRHFGQRARQQRDRGDGAADQRHAD